MRTDFPDIAHRVTVDVDRSAYRRIARGDRKRSRTTDGVAERTNAAEVDPTTQKAVAIELANFGQNEKRVVLDVGLVRRDARTAAE